MMNRRTFLGVTAAGAMGWAAGNAWGEDKGMKYRYWMHGIGSEPKTSAAALKQAGFEVVVAGGDPVIAAIHENGMEAWLCGGAFGVGADETALQAVDINGEHRIWFGSGCPNNPTIRERGLKSYAAMAETKGIQGILVDGCRFASPASGLNAYFTCFCDTCAAKAAKLGFDFPKIKQDVKFLYDLLASRGEQGKRALAWFEAPAGIAEFLTQYPGVLEWLRFRRTCVTEHFRALSGIIHGAKLRMGVYIFTPSLAPLVGQSYVDLAEFMDVFAPMIYRNYPDKPGEACLNWELTNIPEELGFSGAPQEAEAMAAVLSWLGLAQAVPQRTIHEIRAALPPQAIGHQTKMARALIGKDKELAPIIYIDDPLMAQSAEEVRANGANGLNFFVYKDAWADMVRPALGK